MRYSFLLLLATGLLAYSAAAQVAPAPKDTVAKRVQLSKTDHAVYFHRTNPAKPGLVFGHISVQYSKAADKPVQAAMLALDGRIFFADEKGDYSLPVSAGTHSLVAGQIGFYKSILLLKVAQGDSISLNIQLRYDLRPTSN